MKPLENGSTRIDCSSMPEAEQKLFAEAFDTQHKCKTFSDYELSERERLVLDAALKRIIMRSIDLFTTCLCNYMAEGDPKKEALWRVHFWKFMFDSAGELTGQKPRFHQKFWDEALSLCKNVRNSAGSL